MLDFASRLTLASALRYAAWRVARRDNAVALALRSGPRFELRPDSFGNNDYGVAYEVFVHDYYNDRAPFAAEKTELVVDLGANVGFTLLYFLHRYRHCRIIAFEPHPRHFAQAERNLALDGSRDRVQLYALAAGAQSVVGSSRVLLARREPGCREDPGRRHRYLPAFDGQADRYPQDGHRGRRI